MGRGILTFVKWAVAAIALLLLALLLLLYMPWFQRIALNAALETLNADPSRQVAVESVRLAFPIDLEVNGVKVVESGDTLVSADRVRTCVGLLPLLSLKIEAEDTRIENASYRQGTPDSALYLTASGVTVGVDRVTVALKTQAVEVGEAELDGGRVTLALANDTSATATEPSEPTSWQIKVGSVKLKNLDYRMSMLPTIKTLGVTVENAELASGYIDMSTKKIAVGGLVVDGLGADCETPTSEYVRTHQNPVAETVEQPTVESMPWEVTVDSLRVRNAQATYRMAGAEPQPGLDFDYLQVADVEIAVDSLYNRGIELVMPLRQLSVVERSGLELKASGVFAMDSTMMRAEGIEVSTLHSKLSLDALMGLGNPIADVELPVEVKADCRIGFNDLSLAFPAAAKALEQLPRYNDLLVKVDAAGTTSRLKVPEVSASLPGHAAVKVSGEVENPAEFERMGGHLDITGEVAVLKMLKPTLLEARRGATASAPPLKLRGNVEFDRGRYSGAVKALSGEGTLALNGAWNGNSEEYKADVNLETFPINSLLPEMGIGELSGIVAVEGKGYNPFDTLTSIKSEVDVTSIIYKGETYKDLKAWAALADGRADVGVMSFNPAVDLDISGSGNLAGDRLDWKFTGDVRQLDLQAMKLSPTQASGVMSFDMSASMSRDFKNIDAAIEISDVEWRMPGVEVSQNDVNARLSLTDSTVSAWLDNKDLHAAFIASQPLDSLLARIATTGTIVEKMIAERRLDTEKLQRALPQLSLDVTAGSSNIVNSYLNCLDMGFRALNLTVSNDSMMSVGGIVKGFRSGTTRIDSLDVTVLQDGDRLRYMAEFNNEPGTMDEWAHVKAAGYVKDQSLAMYLKQSNIENKTGFRLGAMATVTDTTINLKFAPLNPVIGYKNWTVNSDNYLTINTASRHLDVNINMTGNGSRVELYTHHDPTVTTQEDVVVKVSSLHLADWVSLNPFAPPISGDFSADMRFGWDRKSLNGDGVIRLDELVYDRQRVGTFEAGVDVETSKGGAMRASASLMIDSVKTITAAGTLNDSTLSSPLMLDFAMIHFPLKVVNPFMPAGTAKLSGTLNGTLDVTGELSSPEFNGYVAFDSATVTVSKLGTAFRFSEDSIAVKDNVVTFDKFAVKGINDNALTIDGTVDMRQLINPAINLDMQMRNMQVVGSDRARGADAYGKAYIDLDAKIKGDMKWIDVDAKVDVLAGTNVTYVMAESQSVLASSSNDDMIKFVNFADTVEAAKVDTIAMTGMMMNVNAALNVNPGSTVAVDLSADGSNRVQVQGQGTLNYTMNYMGDSRFTGRYTINKGFARVAPPIPGMSEKMFDFEPGSYVAFNGDMLNPILNLKAVDQIKANVTQEGHNSRLVTFDVELGVTNTLNNMDVAFDLSTSDDLTVQNELQSMSQEQRANQAMNILLYGVYSGAGTKGDAQLGGNMLYSFLESRLNSWVANNIKGVDLSFGIDRYDQTTDGTNQTTTSYSYKVSKTMFNDRFKIVVGGNYTTDATADEDVAQNLVNDISFEYLMNKSGTMYVKLFRHVGYESILEGEVTQTGVGFVYKRKIRRIGDMFRWIPRRKKKQEPAQPEERLTPQTVEKDGKE